MPEVTGLGHPGGARTEVFQPASTLLPLSSVPLSLFGRAGDWYGSPFRAVLSWPRLSAQEPNWPSFAGELSLNDIADGVADTLEFIRSEDSLRVADGNLALRTSAHPSRGLQSHLGGSLRLGVQR